MERRHPRCSILRTEIGATPRTAAASLILNARRSGIGVTGCGRLGWHGLGLGLVGNIRYGREVTIGKKCSAFWLLATARENN